MYRVRQPSTHPAVAADALEDAAVGWGGCGGGKEAEVGTISAVVFHAAPQSSWSYLSAFLHSIFGHNRLMYHPKMK